jgi:hypothetical protein
MPEFTAEIDIDPSEFVSDCSTSEIDELIEILHEDGHLTEYFKLSEILDPNSYIVIVGPDANLMDIEWSEVMVKLSRNRLMLSNEEEELIKKIANRLV